MPVPPVYVLTINGTIVPSLLLGFSIQEVANARNRLTCDILALDGTPRAPLGSSIKLTEDGTTIFGGTIDAPIEAGVGGLPLTATRTRISAVDNNQLAERRVLNLTFPAGTVKSWLPLVLPYLSPFGTTLDAFQVDGPVLPAFSCLFTRVDDALRQISDLTASTASPMVWEIDYDNVLRMKVPAITPAPFAVVDGDRHAIGDVTVEPSQAEYANRVLVLAGEGLHDVQDAYTGNGSTATFALSYSVSATRGYVSNGPTNETISDVSTGGVWWSVDVTVSPNTITRHPSPPAAGNAVTINYTAQFPLLKFADAGGAPAPLPQLWEMIVREPDVFDNASAQQLANSYVAQTSRRPRTVRYMTHERGIHPGMSQHIKITPRHVDTTFLITEVTIQNSSGGAAERLVTAVEGTTFLGSPWQDMIRGWNSETTGISGGRVLIPSGGGGGGGTPIGPGTAGKIAKWTSPTTIGDSGGLSEHPSGSGYTYPGDWLEYAGSLAGGGVDQGGIYTNGTIEGYWIKGRGNYITDLQAANLQGTMPASSLPLFSGDVSNGIAGSSALTIQPGVITNAHVSATAAIAWSKISKAGSSLADLTTRSASDLNSGNLNWAQLPAGAGTWTATPTITGTTTFGSHLYPSTGYVGHIGELFKKFGSLHVAELWAETLVQQQTLATIGGRVLVATTNILVADLATGALSMTVKYNNLALNDRIFMEVNGVTEWLIVNSAASGSAGAYVYAIIRDRVGGGGGQNWAAGDAILNTGQVGSGYIDLYSVLSATSGLTSHNIEAGPTIAGMLRTTSAYYDVYARWAIGNLRGLYGYSASTFGAAFGDPAKSWVTIDDVNGVRMGNAGNVKVQITPAGTATFVGNGSGVTNIDGGNITTGTVTADKINVNSSLVVNAGGNIRQGMTAYATGKGFWLGDSGSVAKFSIGDSTSGGAAGLLTWDGLQLVCTNVQLVRNSATQPTLWDCAIKMLNVGASPAVLFPGRIDTSGGYQASWYLGAHGSYGLYANTGLYLAGSLSVASWVILQATTGKLTNLNDQNTYIDFDVATRIRLVSSLGGASWLSWDGQQLYPNTDGNRFCGEGAHRWQWVYSINGALNTSDERMKRNIAPTAYGSAFLRRLQPIDFEWKNPDHGARRYSGFLAQTIAAHDPDFGGLEFGEDGIARGLSYANLIAPLVAGWSDHDARLAAIEARLGMDGAR